jgi:nucleoside 2-deoxyribosyltransferase
MPRAATVYDILISSPSDVSKERLLAHDLIVEWNRIHSKQQEIILQPVLWEKDARAEMGGPPQKLLYDQIVKECDLAIAFFSTRLGTPTDSDISGTVEEIRFFLNSKRPVLLYFSNMDINRDILDTQQYDNLMKFKDQCKSEGGVIFDYNSLENLKELLSKHLILTIYRILDKGKSIKKNIEENDNIRNQDIAIIYNKLSAIYQRLEIEWDLKEFKVNNIFMNISLQRQNVISPEMKLYNCLIDCQKDLWSIYRGLYEYKFESIRIKIVETQTRIKKFLFLLTYPWESRKSNVTVMAVANGTNPLYPEIERSKAEIIELLGDMIIEFKEIQ